MKTPIAVVLRGIQTDGYNYSENALVILGSAEARTRTKVQETAKTFADYIARLVERHGWPIANWEKWPAEERGTQFTKVRVLTVIAGETIDFADSPYVRTAKEVLEYITWAENNPQD